MHNHWRTTDRLSAASTPFNHGAFVRVDQSTPPAMFENTETEGEEETRNMHFNDHIHEDDVDEIEKNLP